VRFPSLIFAALLQIAPICRAVLVGRAGGGARAAVILGWVAGALAMMGQYDTVSGASASVSGMVKYVGTTPVGSPTNYAAEPVGQIFKYRITVTDPGTDFAENYFNCVPLPPGLTINTNAGAAGYITGTPTAIGLYPVTLVAGNLNYPEPATLPATIAIYPPNTAPVITSEPQPVSVLAGGTATMTVGAFGSLPLACQWRHSGTNLAGRTAATLLLSDVTSAQAGDYQVVLTNSLGSVTSVVARLTVREPFTLDLRLGEVTVAGGAFQCTATGPIYTNYVVWSSSDLADWTPVQTNFVIDGILRFTDPDAGTRPRRFFRVSFGP
jgi:hypothetical protein